MKYISFCLYGNNIKYYEGAIKNAKLINKLLPDWEMVVYYSVNNFISEYELKLSSLGVKLISVDSHPLIKFVKYPMFWRYFIFLEKGRAIIRDLDSRISNRECQYIDSWEKSKKKYFIIRDHPWHSQVPGGLLGLELDDNKIINFFSEFVKKNPLDWGIDQEMLRIYFNDIKKEEVFYCGFDDNTNYIKRDDLNFFIGIQLDENDNPIDPSATLALKFLNSINL
jgi:hypothetical protein